MPLPGEPGGAHELYLVRARIAARVGRLETRDLYRLDALMEKMSVEDARRVARYAEALADWPTCPSSSDDAAQG